MILKPEILTHPHIPKPMHGLSPRTIMGLDWWYSIRKEVYARYNYHCIACGVSQTEAKLHHWLEAHEFWHIDYETGICEITSIEPLCHYCHNFIHSGRMAIILGKEKSKEKIVKILEHGFRILAKNKLKCFPFTLNFAESLCANTCGVDAYDLPDGDVAWKDWKLIWNGYEYHSRFKSFAEWKSFYQNGGK
jgi:hypothetical protein